MMNFSQAFLSISIVLGISLVFFFTDSISVFDSSDEHFWRFRVPPQASNQVIDNLCKWPILELMDTFKQVPDVASRPFTCDRQWKIYGELDSDGLFDLSISNDQQDYRCFYSVPTSPNQLTEISIGPKHDIPNLFFTIRCISKEDDVIYEKSFVNLLKFLKSSNVQRDSIVDPIKKRSSLAILAFSGLSLTSAKTKLRETWKFMEENQFTPFHMYHQKSASKHDNMKLVLDGSEETMAISLMDMTKVHNCLTISNVENWKSDISAHIDLMQMHQLNRDHSQSDSRCHMDGTKHSTSFIDLFKQSLLTTEYSNSCVASFNYMTSFSINDPQLVANVDRELQKTLESLKLSGTFSSTTFVLMGDSGDPDDHIHQKNPLMAIRLSDDVRRRHTLEAYTSGHRLRDIYYYNRRWIGVMAGHNHNSYNFDINSRRLVTNTDIYETLKDIMSDDVHMTNSRESSTGNGGLSLLREDVGSERSCEDIGVPSSECLCMPELDEISKQWTNTSLNYERVFKVVKEVIDQHSCINSTMTVHETKFFSNATIYSLVHLNSSFNGKPLESTRMNETDDVIFVDIGFDTYTYRNRMNRLYRVHGIARVRLHTKSGEMEVLKPLSLYNVSGKCAARTIESLCELCGTYEFNS